MILGVADGVSQLKKHGIDPTKLPEELLLACKRLAKCQLTTGSVQASETYHGPVELLQRAFSETRSLGSLTTVVAWMDNATKVKDQLHPMVTVISVGDCRLLILRRTDQGYQVISHTEMQRVDGNPNTPLQLARVDARIDPKFDERLSLDIIKQGAAVQCVSAYPGDIVVLGSDGVFDNLFDDEIACICNAELPSSSASPIASSQLDRLAHYIVDASLAKTKPNYDGLAQETPIGIGGKVDDTSVVVAEVVPWTDRHQADWWRPPNVETQQEPSFQTLLKLALLGAAACCQTNASSCCEENPEYAACDNFDEKLATPPNYVSAIVPRPASANYFHKAAKR